MELTYRVRLRTRSTDKDYFWVGADPDEWWLGWGTSLLRRQPCLLREVHEGDERILLTRIVSNRRDGSSSRTRIRYDIALERTATATPGDGGAASAPTGLAAAKAVGLVQEWWKQRHFGHQDPWPLGQLIDNLLSRQAFDRGQSIDAFLQLSSAEPVEAALQGLPDWTGPIKTRIEPEPDVAWIGAEHPDTSAYLHSTRSIAYFVAASAKDAERRLGLGSEVVIIADGDDASHQHSRDAQSRPKAEAAGPPRITRPHQVRLWTIVLLAALTLALAIVLLAR